MSTLIRPTRGLRPADDRAAEVAAPPYDVLNSAEAYRLVYQGTQKKPWSFLHVSKPEIDLPQGTDPYSPEVYAKATENINRMISAGVLIRDDSPCYYAYRLTMGKHVQTGLVACASVASYDSNRIRKHEFTRPEKEDDRVRQIEATNAHTGPVLLAYPDNSKADELIEKITRGKTIADYTADDDIRHQIWLCDDINHNEEITRCFDNMESLYIADGHHRSAAASRVAAARRIDGLLQASDYFLTVIFPQSQMKILDYNRVVKDLNGMDAAELLQKLSETFEVSESIDAVSPSQPGEFGMYLSSSAALTGGQWFRLNIDPQRIPADPIEQLDVSLLSNYLLAPLFGIKDLRRDIRIDFVGGIRGLGELERRCDSGEMAVAFSLFPTSMDQLMAVADSNQVMPPKSTWFEPKLADGLVSHMLD